MAKKRQELPEEKAEMDMSPMIDCVFLLLIFFIVVSSQAEVQVDTRVKPTIAPSSAIQESNIGRIVVNAFYVEGSIVYSDEDSKEIAKSELQAYIKQQKGFIQENRPGEPVTLHLRCHRALSWKDIKTVKVEASKEGVTNINFASYQKNPNRK